MDFASLGIRIETAEVKTGTAELDKLTVSAERAEKAVDNLAPSSAAASKQVGQLAAGARTVGPALAGQAQQFQAAGISARQYAFALRTVPAQITDIVTGLASGQNPFLVAIQQGGQLRDVFGGFGNALRGLGTILTPTRLALLGIAGAGFTIASAFKSGQEESAKLANAIVLSGGAAGVTASELRELAKSIDAIAGTQGQAANALALLTASGKVAGENLRELALIAVQVERSVGTPIENTVKQFVELGRDPINNIKKLNEQFNFLTANTLRQVNALSEQGRLFEAGAVAQEAFRQRLEQISREAETNLGTLQRLGRGVADIFREARDSLLDIGRSQTSQGALEATLKEVQGIQDILDKSGGLNDTDRGFLQQRLADRRAFAEALKEDLQKEKRLADQQAAIAGQRQKEVQDEEKRIAKRKELASMEEQLRKARVGADVAGIKRALDGQLDAFANSEAELDALRSAGLVRDQDFFDRKRELIEQNTAAQVSALQQQNERLMKENSSGVAQLMNQQEIKDNEAEIARLRASSISQLNVLTIQQKAAAEAITRQYVESRAAAEEFIKTLNKQFEREIALQGAGTKARNRAGDRQSLTDRFDAQRDEVRGEFRRGELGTGADAEKKLKQQLDLIDEFESKAISSQDKFFERLDQNQSDFFVGAREAINNYIDDASNFSKASENLLTNAFTGAEDALVRFATTGKLSFKDLANSIIQDLIRIQVRALIVRAIAGSGVLSGGASAGASAGASIAARASGGPVSSGQPYLVGERGPELFVPRSSGQIIPTKQTMQLMSGRTTSATVVQNINISGGGMDPGAVRRMGEEIRQQAIAGARTAIAEDLRRGRLDTQLQGAQR